jgi:hypothetical protein
MDGPCETLYLASLANPRQSPSVLENRRSAQRTAESFVLLRLDASMHGCVLIRSVTQ